MKRLIGGILAGAMAVSVLSGCSPAANKPSETSATVQNAEVRPQDDFYRYINEPRLKDAKFEYGTGIAGSAFNSDKVDKQLDEVVKSIVAGSGYEAGSEEDLIKKAYNAYLSYDFKNEPIPKDLASVIDEVSNANSVDELFKLDAKLFKEFSVSNILNLSVEVNSLKSDEKIMCFRNFKSVCGVDMGAIREDNQALNTMVSNIRTILMTRGYDADAGKECGKKLANLALKIYGSTNMNLYDNGHNLSNISMCSKDEINKILTNVNLSEYIRSYGIDEKYCEKVCVFDRSQLECLNSILTDENLDALKAWRLYTIYQMYMKVIAPHYPDLNGYVKDSYDAPETQAINVVKSVFVAETDPVYVERFYKKETDDALRKMCDDIKDGYRKLISKAKWLSEPTKTGLLKKLNNIVYVTGIDLKRHDNSKFADLSGNYYELVTRYKRIKTAEIIADLEKPVDRLEINMEMQEMNASYIAVYNSITITVAITNEPFFDAGADYYTNLGGLGSIIAHEMGHAFDSNNIVYDQNGSYNPKWIAEEDLKTLSERNEKAISYFQDNFTVFGIHHVDGKQTLGENFADLGGMECVTSLAKNKDDLIKIFERYAVIWGMKQVDVMVIDQLAYDVHSPEIIRVNAILSALDCFYDAYGVKEGDKMYIAPEKRVSRWY